jgi:hypothetical protein
MKEADGITFAAGKLRRLRNYVDITIDGIMSGDIPKPYADALDIMRNTVFNELGDVAFDLEHIEDEEDEEN